MNYYADHTDKEVQQAFIDMAACYVNEDGKFTDFQLEDIRDLMKQAYQELQKRGLAPR